MSNLAARNLSDEDESDTDGEPQTPFSVDLDTEGLVRYLDAEFGKLVIRYVRKNNINGKSFLSLTHDDLKSTKIPPGIQNNLLEKVAVLKEHTCKSKPDDSKFVRKLILHLCIFIIILGRRFI